MPRPRKYREPKNQTVTFDALELTAIRAEAKRQGEPLSAFIRRRVLQALGMAGEEEETGTQGDK